MMLRQSPKLKNLPKTYLESIQFFYKNQIYPNFSPKDIADINMELDQFLHEAETELQKGLIKSIGLDGFKKIADMFKIKTKTDSDQGISPAMLKDMESKLRGSVEK